MKKVVKYGIVLVFFILLVLVITKGIDGNSTANGDDAYRLKVLQALKEADASLYTTATCSYCARQKEILGPNRDDYVRIVDCTEEYCPGVSHVPAWEINGELYEGLKELSELAEILEI